MVDDLRSELRDRYSYLDVLALAVARAGATEFSTDPLAWASKIHALRDQFPDLLAGVWFTERGYSEEIDAFFRIMARSGSFSFANPRYDRFELTEAAKADIEKEVTPVLAEHSAAIDAIAQVLSELRTH